MNSKDEYRREPAPGTSVKPRGTTPLARGRRQTLVWLSLAFIAGAAGADVPRIKQEQVVSLPSGIAQTLRARNPGGRAGCPVSNIFIHGFHYLDTRFDRVLWFLGAPDYLCETNAFVPAIVTREGEWTVGRASGEDWSGHRMLAGAPLLFRHSAELGFFLIAEWQAGAGPNYLYYAPNGETWVSVPLPAAAPKNPNVTDCCAVASIRRLCVVESGAVVVAYEDSSYFHAGTWSSPVDEAFPETVAWTRTETLPDAARCDEVSSGDFVPRNLREKTSNGAIFDMVTDWSVHIPGPTK